MINLFEEACETQTNLLFSIVLGSSGSGKSRVAGTAPGKTLYLYFQGERHGPASAAQSGGDLLPVCLDRSRDGADLTADETFKRGLSVLDLESLKAAGIKSIVLDGLTELEKVVRQTKVWANSCMNSSGKHNNFAEPAATLEQIDRYMTALRRAQDALGIHIVVTGILDVQEIDDNGAIGTAKPRLSGYSVAEGLIQQFGDILVVGRMKNAKGESGYVFQTATDVQRISKDAAGNVRKFINFTPRIAGASTLPPYIKADLNEIIKLKSGK